MSISTKSVALMMGINAIGEHYANLYARKKIPDCPICRDTTLYKGKDCFYCRTKRKEIQGKATTTEKKV